MPNPDNNKDQSETDQTSGSVSSSGAGEKINKKVIHRAGGRHLVFRINRGHLWFVPKPYALISNIEGSILVFYGIGQLWATHKKLRRVNEWWARVPRFVSKRIRAILDDLEPDISTFIDDVKDLDLIGTLIVERKVIEFHWTVTRDQRGDDETESNRKKQIDASFNKLATAFAKLQLAGVEGQHDVPEEAIQLAEN